jgi:hypothetical protein
MSSGYKPLALCWRVPIIVSRRFGLVVAFAFACLLASSLPASALAIMLDAGNDGVGILTITDNGAGDLDSDLGQLLYTGNVAGFLVNLTFSISNSPRVSGAGDSLVDANEYQFQHRRRSSPVGLG